MEVCHTPLNEEREMQINKNKSDKLQFEKLKHKLKNLFDPEAVESEVKRLNKHLTKIRNEQWIKKEKDPPIIRMQLELLKFYRRAWRKNSNCIQTA